MEHPEEISKMSAVKSKVEEVKSIMVQNVEQVLARGEKLDVLVDKTDDLRDQVHTEQCLLAAGLLAAYGLYPQ